MDHSPTDIVALVEELRREANRAGVILTDPPKPSAAMALFTRAADALSAQAARIAELEAIATDLITSLNRRGKMITVSHDDLSALEKRARKTLGGTR